MNQPPNPDRDPNPRQPYLPAAIPLPPIAPPTAPPVVSTPDPLSINKSGPSTSSSSGNTPRPTAAWRPRLSTSTRTGRRGLLNVRAQLSERDYAIVSDVARHRFLNSKHIYGLHFTDHNTPSAGQRACRNALQRLHQWRLLTHLDRRVGGVRAGSASYVWRLGPVGDRLLKQDGGNGAPQRSGEPSVRFLDHYLAIADLHVALVDAHRAQQMELIDVQLEPACWRPFTGIAGERNVLQPDLAVVTGAGDFEDHWMVEVDLGNEHIPTILKKCQQYLVYRDSGTEQRDGGVFPAVVWVMPTAVHAMKLGAAIASARQLDVDLFRFTTPDTFLNLIAGGAV